MSRANSTQRKGRAGRVTDGGCFKLEQQIQEFHRSPLEHICLQIKLLKTSTSPSKRKLKPDIGGIAKILSRCVEPPPIQTIEYVFS